MKRFTTRRMKLAFGALLFFFGLVEINLNYVAFRYIRKTKGKIISKSGLRSQLRGDDRRYQQVTSDGSLYAYSAYYDSRDEPLLRVFVICTQVFRKISYSCKIQLQTGEIHVVNGSFYDFWDILRNRYVPGVVKCPLTKCCVNSSELEFVSVSPSTVHNFTILHHKLRIVFPGPKTHTLTRCYPPIHNKYSKVNELIWNIEISKLSGVDKFIFYNYSFSPAVDKTLRHYIQDGVVEVRDWNIPVIDGNMIHYYGQLLAIHDCLTSQMSAAKYVLLADLDEIFLPRKGLSLVRLADDVFSYGTGAPKSNIGSIVFQCFSSIVNSSHEFRDNRSELAEARRLKIEPLLHTIFFEPYIESRKALVIPERVETMFVHNALSLRNGFKHKHIGRLDGVMLHFRNPNRGRKLNSSVFTFNDLLKFSKEIVSAIARRTQALAPQL